MVKTIIVGSDLPAELHKELIIRAKEVANRFPVNDTDVTNSVQVVELVEMENVKILQTRNQLVNQENIADQLQNLEFKQKFKEDAITFIERIKRNIATVSELKNETAMSWKQFNILLENWSLFGFISYLDEKRTVVKFTLDEADIKENILAGLTSDLDVIIQKIRAVKNQFTPEEVKQLSAFERKLKLNVNVSR